MSDKDYRELQISSSQLVLILVGILVLSVVVFLLGISVGKKQTKIAQNIQISPNSNIENVKEEKVPPVEESKEGIIKELASHRKATEKLEQKPESVEKQNLYYIQVGAFNNKKAAKSVSEEFKKQGFSSLVFDPFPKDKKSIFRVRIGGYKTKEEAENVKKKLIKEGKRKDYFLVKY